MTGSATHRKVLVVEDEWLLAKGMVDAVQTSGPFTSWPVASVEAAFESIDRTKIDAVILDVQLGSESSDGIAFILLRLGIPFLVVTGYTPSQLPAVFHRGTILGKPVDDDDLAAAIRTHFL